MRQKNNRVASLDEVEISRDGDEAVFDVIDTRIATTHLRLGPKVQSLNDDEICFYDALAQNESALEAMGIDDLKVIATELVTRVRKSVTIDWTLRESARAKIRIIVRRILRKHGYPPDL